MKVEWDEAKRRENLRKHGVDFLDAPELFNGPMLVSLDDRENYGEDRQVGFGYLQGRPMVVVFTEPRPGTIRIISLRKASSHEENRFSKTIGN